MTVRSRESVGHGRGVLGLKSARLGVLLIALLALLFALTGCSPAPSGTSSPGADSDVDTSAPQSTTASATESGAPSESTESPSAESSANDLKIKDLVVGKGVAAKPGDQLLVDYTGWFMDGTKFDSSIGKAPFPFVLGQGQVIEGWDKGVEGMKVGGTRQLIVPSSMGYGAQGRGSIPPNATLKFKVKLLKITPAAQ